MDTNKVKEILVGHGKESAKEILLAVLYPALEKAIADSPNKFDDAALLALGSTLKSEIIKAIDGL